MDLLQTILTAYESVSMVSDLENLQMYMRTALEPLIFNELKRKYMGQLQTWYKSYKLPHYDSTDKILFVYETRPHENLAFLLYSLCYFARGWGLHIACKESNRVFVEEILGENTQATHIETLPELCGKYEDERNGYNAFMKSPVFWNGFLETHKWILTAEVDSYLRLPIPEDIFQYDFCASLWSWKEGPGGGGITLRSIPAMQTICRELPLLEKQVWAQDCWASEGIKQLGYSYNPTYFMESCLQHEAVGVHQWWSFCIPLSDERLSFFNSYITLKIDNDMQLVK